MVYEGAKNQMIKSMLRSVLPGVLLVCAGLLTAADADINQMISSAVKAGQKKVTLPAGTFRMNTVELLDLEDFTLEGAAGGGTTLVFSPDRGVAILIYGSKQITLRNLQIDFSPLAFTQGTVLAVDGSKLTVKIHAGYPPPARLNGLAMHVFDPQTRLWKTGAPDFFGVKAEPGKEAGTYQISSPNPPGGYIMPGDLVVFDWRSKEGIAVKLTRNLLMEDVTIFGSPSLGISGRYILGQHIFRRVKIMRGPTPAGATEPRLFSTSADGLNYALCVKGPLVEDCDFSFMGDDGINFHGMIAPVIEQESPTSLLLLRPYPGEKIPELVAPGMEVRFLKSGNFAIQGTGEVASFTRIVKQLEPGTPGKYYPLFRNNMKTPSEVYRLTLKNPVQVPAGSFLDIPGINSPGFIIRNSYFHDHRGRALRLMASDGLVENCRIERISQNAITIGPEYGFWREAGWVSNLTIRNNRIKDVGFGFVMTSASCYAPGAIASIVRPDQTDMEIKAGHHNLAIENNLIENSGVPGIFLNAVDGAKVSGNTLRHVATGKLDKAGAAYRLKAGKPLEVTASCKDINVSDNKIE